MPSNQNQPNKTNQYNYHNIYTNKDIYPTPKQTIPSAPGYACSANTLKTSLSFVIQTKHVFCTRLCLLCNTTTVHYHVPIILYWIGFCNRSQILHTLYYYTSTIHNNQHILARENTPAIDIEHVYDNAAYGMTIVLDSNGAF
jgi:hypothetical protein